MAETKRKRRKKILSEGDLARRAQRAEDWRMFRRDRMFTQRRLAEVVGISRRTIQKVEMGYVEPHSNILRRFADFKRKHDMGAKLNLSL